jgi:hypothetical protein
LNASIASIQSGLKPDYKFEFADGTTHYVFYKGQHRRQIGEGHSGTERKSRRENRNADYKLRREYKRGRREA